MSLEQHIKSKFKNEKHKAGVNLIYTANFYQEKISQILKNAQADITSQQYNVLRILRGSAPKPLSIKDIKERMLDKMSDVSRIVEKLREKEYLQRQESPQDRRNVEIRITAQGLALLQSLESAFDALESYFDLLTHEEVVLLNQLLDKIRG